MRRVPERHKKDGVCYAETDDGLELPVIDVTHPAFAFEKTPEELEAIAAATFASLERSRRAPRFVLRLMARRSRVMRDTLAAAGGYLSGMGTYLQKLGPENMGEGWAGSLDRRLAGSIVPTCMRLRLRDSARLLADGVADACAAGDRRPIHFVNIGGGVGSDSLNAMIILARQHPGVATGHRMVLHVLDLDPTAPSFGARALSALEAPGGPLELTDVLFEHVLYDWAHPARLHDILCPLVAAAPIVACSSEGGLFEYASDDDVAANLATLRAVVPDDAIVVGSVLLDAETARGMNRYGRLSLRLRTPDAVRKLVGRAGWSVAAATLGSLYWVVSLRKAGAHSPSECAGQ